MVILAVLAGLVAPRFIKRGEEAKITAAKADISTIDGALDQYYLDCGDQFPSQQDGLSALVSQPGSAKGWKGPYLKKGLPKDPWGQDYVYEHPGKHNADGVDIYSCGPDGNPGTEDDIANWNN